MLKITAYGDRLLNDLDDLDWPESIKEMQRNWIGRSEGAQLAFDVPGVDGSLEVYTTRPDTLFGATYLVVAQEHPLVDALTSDEQNEAVEEYVLAASRKSDLERTELAKEKTGVFTGTHATHPLTGEDVPVWVADYVLGTYGTGAIMAVPAHDDRDFEFATQFGLPVVQVVQPPEGAEEGACHAGAGKMVNSACDALDVNEMDNVEAGAKVTEWLEAKGIGAKKVNFKLRDWLFARQRYWGEPFPVVYAEGSDEPIPVPLEQLPLTLPETDNFKPSGSGEGPLANVEDWVQTTDPAAAAPRDARPTPCPSGRVVLVLPPFHRPQERERDGGRQPGEVLDARGPVRGRRGARGAAPPVRAILAQGAVRHRRGVHEGAVPAAGLAGHDPRRDGVRRVRGRGR